jgi:hypothetical protein
MHLQENSRPPSKGGNTNALHAHILTIEGKSYSFLALGSQRWVFKTDTVSFEYEIKNGYNNIVKETLATLDKTGRSVVRGNRGYKTQLRTALARTPASRREQRD